MTTSEHTKRSLIMDFILYLCTGSVPSSSGLSNILRCRRMMSCSSGLSCSSSHFFVCSVPNHINSWPSSRTSALFHPSVRLHHAHNHMISSERIIYLYLAVFLQNFTHFVGLGLTCIHPNVFFKPLFSITNESQGCTSSVAF